MAVASRPQLPDPSDLDALEAMSAEELIAWTHRTFWPRLCLTCSWQKQSSVLVHMVAELGLPRHGRTRCSHRPGQLIPS